MQPVQRVHPGGEGDLRACYIAMAVAHMLCLDKEDLARRAGMVDYVQRCQVGKRRWVTLGKKGMARRAGIVDYVGHTGRKGISRVRAFAAGAAAFTIMCSAHLCITVSTRVDSRSPTDRQLYMFPALKRDDVTGRLSRTR